MVTMNIPTVYLDSIVFLEIKDGDFYKQVGTAFVVDHLEVGVSSAYLVTCYHVVIEMIDHNSQLYIRVNRKDGSGIEHFPIPNDWTFHMDNGVDKVDLAVWLINDGEVYQNTVLGAIDSNQLYGREGLRQHFDKDVEVGDDIIFIGLFEHFPGNSKNYPLVRSGRIALLAEESIPGVALWLGVSDYFLVECQAYPGMSGSPVFVMRKHNGNEQYYLVGIMAGYYEEDEIVKKKFTHYGISLVVPVEKLGDIIFGLIRDLKEKNIMF